MRQSSLIPVAIAAGLVGCSSLSAERLQLKDLRSHEEVEGLVVGVSSPHRVTAVFPTSPGSGEIVAFEEIVPLPSVNEYYVIGYLGNLFTSRELQVELNPDSSLKRVKLTSVTTLADDLQSIGTALQGVQAELTEIQSLPEAPNPIDAANADLRREIINQMLEANRAAVADGKAPPYNGISLP